MIEVSKESRGGGVAVFRKAEYDLFMDTYSINHIDAVVNKGKEGEWRFIGFYSEPDTFKRHESWVKLRRLKNKYSLPWLCSRDFNEICRAHEKLGGRLRPIKQMEEFREVLDECGFQDLGFVGNKFTWCNGHEEGFTIWEMLDRAVATTNWVARFPATKVLHLECGSSDHKPLVILPMGVPKKRWKPWRFEQMWLKDDGCRDILDSVWRQQVSGRPMVQVEEKIKICQARLSRWSRLAFGNITRALAEEKIN